jgi:hypothetical protein
VEPTRRRGAGFAAKPYRSQAMTVNPTVSPVNNSSSIASFSSVVKDTGRRGTPKRGCDCMECFGYCIVQADAAVREQTLKFDVKPGME